VSDLSNYQGLLKALEAEICRQFQRSRVKLELLEPITRGLPEAVPYKVHARLLYMKSYDYSYSSYWRNIVRARFFGENIDEVQLWVLTAHDEMTLEDALGGKSKWADTHGRWCDIHFVVHGRVEGLEEQMAARYGGLMRPRWKGGTLADKLNEDATLKSLLKDDWVRRVRVTPDRPLSCVRIIFEPELKVDDILKDTQPLLPRLTESLQISRRIAHHIRGLTKDSHS